MRDMPLVGSGRVGRLEVPCLSNRGQLMQGFTSRSSLVVRREYDMAHPVLGAIVGFIIKAYNLNCFVI